MLYQVDNHKDSSNVNWNYIIITIAFVTVAIIGILSIFKPWQTIGFITSEESECPYPCCIGLKKYEDKSCPIDYECKANQCSPMDSDNDGLSDIDERAFGSNPKIYDEDGDGLSAYQEKQRGTDPNNPNTDFDRYNDNIDSNPTVTDTAIIEIGIIDKKWSWEWLGILGLIKDLDPDFTIATGKVDVNVCNVGTDYTSYVRFDNVFKIQGIEVMRIPERIDRINENDCVSKHYEYEFTVKQVPQTVWELVKEKTTNWSYEYQNLVYEKF